VLALSVLARAVAGLPYATIRSDVLHLEQVQARFGSPMQARGSPMTFPESVA